MTVCKVKRVNVNLLFLFITVNILAVCNVTGRENFFLKKIFYSQI